MLGRLLFFGVIVIVILISRPAFAFTPHYLLNDQEFEDSTAWTLPEIKNFLETKGSPLASYAPRDVDGSLKKAADIIAIAGRKHRVNPKVLLVLLQKEQSLVEGEIPRPSFAPTEASELRRGRQASAKGGPAFGGRDDGMGAIVRHRLNWATGYGVCDDCRKSDSALQKFLGFAKQVDFAAQRLRYFFDHPKEFKIQKGKTVRIDRQQITPLSRATAALYLYTPHIHGNQNFWAIWNRWFEQRYPEGAVLKKKGTEQLWVISNGRRRKVGSVLAISEVQQRAIISVSPDELLKYRVGKPLTGSPFRLVRTPDRTVWLLGIADRRRIANADVLRTIGYNPEEIEEVPKAALKDYREDPVITDALGAATIQLVKIPTSSTVYLLEREQKRPFVSATVFEQLGYQWDRIVTVAEDILGRYPDGAPIELVSERQAQKALEEFHDK